MLSVATETWSFGTRYQNGRRQKEVSTEQETSEKIKEPPSTVEPQYNDYKPQ